MSGHVPILSTREAYFDLTALSSKERYRLLLSTIVPRPIAWVVTLERAGQANAAPFSFFNAFATDPPVVGIGIGCHGAGRPKATRRKIAARKEFVINLVSEEMAEAMNVTAIGFSPGVNELAEAGLETRASTYVRPPRIARSPVAMECELMQNRGARARGPGWCWDACLRCTCRRVRFSTPPASTPED